MTADSLQAVSLRLAATVSEWRARLRHQILRTSPSASPEADFAAAQEGLRQELAALEREANAMDHDLGREMAAAAGLEQEAMSAVAANDDSAARAALERQQQRIEAASALQEEVKLLKAMAESFRQALSTLAELKTSQRQ